MKIQHSLTQSYSTRGSYSRAVIRYIKILNTVTACQQKNQISEAFKNKYLRKHTHYITINETHQTFTTEHIVEERKDIGIRETTTIDKATSLILNTVQLATNPN